MHAMHFAQHMPLIRHLYWPADNHSEVAALAADYCFVVAATQHVVVVSVAVVAALVVLVVPQAVNVVALFAAAAGAPVAVAIALAELAALPDVVQGVSPDHFADVAML